MAKRSKNDTTSPRDFFANIAIEQVLPPAKRAAIANGTVKTVLVEVPHSSWVLPLADSLELLGEKVNIIRRLDGKRPDEESAAASRWLGQGAAVVYVAASVGHIPKWFRHTVQEHLPVPQPDHVAVARLVKGFCGGRLPSGFAKLNFGLLDFDEITAVVAQGGTATDASERFSSTIANKTRTVRTNERLPDLGEALEFGAAREWGLDLKVDLDDFRAKRVGWDSVDRGAILHGPPGTGKTLFARSLAQYLGVPLIQANFAEMFASSSGYLDGMIKAQRVVFESARAAAPCLLFMDEIDQVPDLDRVDSRHRDYWSVLVADFLTLLDGAGEGREGVVVLGATNRIDAISPAVRRPGRLERTIHLGLPSSEGIVRIIQHHAPTLVGADLSAASKAIEGLSMTPAQIMEAVRGASRRARRAERGLMVADIMDGLLPPLDLPPAHLRRIALHEAGHCIACIANAPNSLRTVVMSNERAFTRFEIEALPAETWQSLQDRAVILLAGRAAEIIHCGGVSSGGGGGVGSDLGTAAREFAVARTSLGLHGSSWSATPDNFEQVLKLDPQLRAQVAADIGIAEAGALRLLMDNEAVLLALADAILERRYLDADSINRLVESLGGVKPASAQRRGENSLPRPVQAAE